MKTEARKMAEKMSKSKKAEDINELAREIQRGGKPRGISSDIPAGIREKLMEKERESLFKGEGNKYAKGGAVKQGKRYGEEKPVQRNVDDYGEYKQRSPGQSNANRLAASVKEDVGVSSKRDIERVGRGMSPTGKTELTRGAQIEAGKRAALRMASRAGYLGAALGAGYEVGDLVNKGIDKMAEGKVKLSDYAKQRMKEEEDFKAMESALRKVDEDARKEKEKKMAKGGMSTKQEAKVGKVMKEFKGKSLHSGKGGKVVTNPKQAIAIALSEARRMKKK